MVNLCGQAVHQPERRGVSGPGDLTAGWARVRSCRFALTGRKRGSARATLSLLLAQCVERDQEAASGLFGETIYLLLTK